MSETVIIPSNEFQTPITREWLERYPSEVQEQFMDYMDTVPLLKYMVGPRKRASELARDERGRIIVDITHPHILTDMDYFRPMAKFFQENGCYTFLRPNSNPNSEFGKLLAEEVRRCRDGYVRESDGEWVTGQLYWFLNYCPIMLNREVEHSGMFVRVQDFPDFWEGIYYRFHYLDQARHIGKHGLELARRGCAKSFSLAGIMSHNLILGENLYAKERVTTVLTAYLKEYLSQKDGTFSKFTPIIDHVAATTEFPRLMLTRRAADLLWVMGYKNANGNERGSRNAVMGLSVKDDEGKIRGKRGTILFEEIGSYPNFKEVWNNVRDSVKEGSRVFSQLYGVGTAGDDESDFSGVRTMLYNPDAYEIYALDNVYDKLGKGATKFAYFFPSYISRAGCMDKDGNSDVVKALMEILMERYMVQKGGDAASLLSRIAQMPITPEEAILKVRSNFFPTLMLNERIRQIDTDPHFYDDVYIGELIENKDGKVEFHANNDIPIRKYPADALEPGALEIYSMPPSDNIPMNRYVIGVDPVDNDKAESESLMSALVFDLFNDEIVAEYTGRKQYARDGYEVVRLLAVFYNAQVMYESNRKLMFSHFQAKKCLWMLADCPDWIKSKGLIKYDLFGSNKKGVSVNGPLISTGIELINDWLKKTIPVTVKDERGESHIEDVPIVYGIRNRALLEELVSYGPGKNTDRVSALFQVMFYREQFTILYGENGSGIDDEPELTDDPFFNKDWDRYQARLGESYKSAFGL